MERLPSSFRDPSGFIFKHEGKFHRQVNDSYLSIFDAFMASGLYTRLVERQLLIPHAEVEQSNVPGVPNGARVILPEQIPVISYPYEWSFSQYKEAAMVTLRIQAEAIKHGFVLKDASAYNIQFHRSKAVFIDTLSFEPLVENQPWVAYKQFCQHFLAPLALMAYTDISLSKLLIAHIDGIPLPLASKLLPFKTRFNYSLASHIHLHSRLQESYGDAVAENQVDKAKSTQVSTRGLTAMAESLASIVNKLEWKMPKTEWGDYYENTNYSNGAGDAKRALVDQFLTQIPDQLTVIQDCGANTGEFSRIAAQHCEIVVSQDIDPVAVELNVRKNRASSVENILPLLQNFSAPSPAIGWANTERDSFLQRTRSDALMVLALIHHLAISNNVPLEDLANLFAGLARWLVIEFVPKEDSQVERLLATRVDIFPEYTRPGFEAAFSEKFSIEHAEDVPECERRLYLMKRR